MSPASAKRNVIPYLKQTGIIDEEGKPLDRAIRWREDEEYPKVCEEIKREIYPQELLDTVPDPSADRDRALRWFSLNTGLGKIGVGKVVAFYTLICEADPEQAEERTISRKRTSQPKASDDVQTPIAKTEHKPEVSIEDANKPPKDKKSSARIEPQFNFNIQIVLPENAESDTYNDIFKAIAVHLLRRDEE